MADKDDLIIQRIDDLKDATNSRLESIDDNLAEHMRRTEILEKLHMDNQKRIHMLEEPKIVIKYVKSTLLLMSAVAGVVLTLISLAGKM
tara:strand:- start:151 stop:417 length:267 start_codon:yes stop_codon:yes gene_type:complete